MKLALALLVVAGCTDDVSYGAVQVIDLGQERVSLRACLDADFLSCEGEDVVLHATHDGAQDDMTYAGWFFPQHHGSVELGDRSAPFVISDGRARVHAQLPPAFELATTTVEPITAGDSVALTWRGADYPMVWSIGYECPREGTSPKYGNSMGDTIDDDGEHTITVARLAELMDEPSTSGCEVEIELSRVREGDVDDGFRAERATAIVRRLVTVTFAR